jgi:hypothetical protein
VRGIFIEVETEEIATYTVQENNLP